MKGVRSIVFGCLLATTGAIWAATLDPATQTAFVNKLTAPPVIDARGGGHFVIPIISYSANLGVKSPTLGSPMSTPMYCYDGVFPGPTILAKKGVQATFEFPNMLVDGNNNPIPHMFGVDRTLHWANPLNQPNTTGGYTGPIPTTVHLHGGKLSPESDGHPDSWYTPNYAITGGEFASPIYVYPNNQQAATLFYHDHSLGMTRLNVYAGMAGFYLIQDSTSEKLIMNGSLPGPDFDLPLHIQDREFNDDGTLQWPSTGVNPNPTWNPQFFGRFMLVNGKVWPYHKVQPRTYRVRLLNACDSRFLNLKFSNNMSFTLIASDQGFLPAPKTVNSVLLAPGERAEVLVDFAKLKSGAVTLTNDAKAPYPNGTSPNAAVEGRIMRFQLAREEDLPKDTFIPGKFEGIPRQTLSTTLPVRKIVLGQKTDVFGRAEHFLGTATAGYLRWQDPVTELPQLNSTEIWEIYNNSNIGHPIHLHLVAFQLLSRQTYTATVYNSTGIMTNVVLTGTPSSSGPTETGWKDTIYAPPRQVTRIIAKYDILGNYVFHCHMLSHEDHDMMRPFTVVP